MTKIPLNILCSKSFLKKLPVDKLVRSETSLSTSYRLEVSLELTFKTVRTLYYSIARLVGREGVEPPKITNQVTYRNPTLATCIPSRILFDKDTIKYLMFQLYFKFIALIFFASWVCYQEL